MSGVVKPVESERLPNAGDHDRALAQSGTDGASARPRLQIARSEEAVAHSVVVRVRSDECEGIGEATPIERYGESVASVIDYFRTHELSDENPHHLEALLHGGIPAAARAGLDLALHDLIGKQLGGRSMRSSGWIRRERR